jgi:DNA-binding transcriptional ArsR family regulator
MLHNRDVVEGEMVDSEAMSRTFGALADPTRRAILHRLAAGEATVGELAEPFQMTQQAISRHIKVLEEAGLVSRRRVGQTRPCRLEPERLTMAAGWIAQQHQLWEERHDRLEDHLSALADGGRKRPRK